MKGTMSRFRVMTILAVSLACFGNAAGQLTETKLNASDAAAFDFFGSSVSINGDTAIIGALFDDDAGTDSGSAYIFVRSGGSWSQTAKLVASDAATGDNFGASVSISGDTAIVGAFRDTDAGDFSGSAYLFQDTSVAGDWSSFTEIKLTASNAAAGDFFGASVSISGDTAIVGSRGNDDAALAAGSAYVYQDTSAAGDWSSITETELIASDAAAQDFFGISVSISGDTAIIGARFDDDAGMDSGSAYIFIRNGASWSQVAKLTASDGAADDFFGSSVSVTGDTVIVGAFLDDDAGTDSGSAYVYQDTSAAGDWSSFAEIKLVAADAEIADLFGISVSISGDTVIVGADASDDSGLNAGSAYLFQDTSVGGNWSSFTETKLVAADAATNDLFGGSVSISGNTVIVGAFRDNDGGTFSGSAYVFGLGANAPPVANAGADQSLECEGVDGALVSLDGSGSTDADSSAGTNDDIALFQWLLSGSVIATGEHASVTLPLGTHSVTLLVTDSLGATDEDTVQITVVDTTSPSLSLSVTPHVLWPANHKMIDVIVSAGATDLCDLAPTLTLVSVTNSESDNAGSGGDGNTNNDIQNADIGTADFDVSLRAERRGNGDGRVYTLTYRATDASGNWAEESVTVDVPHDTTEHSCDQPDCDLNP